MNKYEYRVERVSGDEYLVNILAAYGDKGWELVSTNFHWWHSQYDLFFKREMNG